MLLPHKYTEKIKVKWMKKTTYNEKRHHEKTVIYIKGKPHINHAKNSSFAAAF